GGGAGGGGGRGSPRPTRAGIRGVVDKEQERGRRQTLDHAVEHRLRLGVDPVKVLEHDQERLDLTLPKEKPSQGLDGPLPPRGRGQNLPPAACPRALEGAEGSEPRAPPRPRRRGQVAPVPVSV